MQRINVASATTDVEVAHLIKNGTKHLSWKERNTVSNRNGQNRIGRNKAE